MPTVYCSASRLLIAVASLEGVCEQLILLKTTRAGSQTSHRALHYQAAVIGWIHTVEESSHVSGRWWNWQTSLLASNAFYSRMLSWSTGPTLSQLTTVVAWCVQTREGGSLHPAQLEALPGAQGLPAVPPQGCAPAVCLASQACSPRAAHEACLSKGSWQTAAGLCSPLSEHKSSVMQCTVFFHFACSRDPSQSLNENSASVDLT